MTPEEAHEQTKAHIRRVQAIAAQFADAFLKRVKCHDASKLESPEAEGFAKHTAALSGLTYGSPEYSAQLEEMKAFVEHHYEMNSHHPEHFSNSISGMTLFDFLEMFCDWLAAVERHNDGDIFKSIEYNKGRFDIPTMLADILRNTAEEFVPRNASSILWSGENWSDVYNFIQAINGKMKSYSCAPDDVLTIRMIGGGEVVVCVGQIIVRDIEGYFSMRNA